MDYALTLFTPMMGGLMLGLWLMNERGYSPMWAMGLAGAGFACGIVLLWKRAAYPQLYNDTTYTTDAVNAEGENAGTSATRLNTSGTASTQTADPPKDLKPLEHPPGNLSPVGNIYGKIPAKTEKKDPWDDDDWDKDDD